MIEIRQRPSQAGHPNGVGAHALSPLVVFVILLTGLAAATAVFLDVRAPAGPSAAVVEAEHRNVDPRWSWPAWRCWAAC